MLSLNAVGHSNDENNFPHKLILSNTQVSRLRKAFTNGSSANIKWSKIQLHKIGQLGEFLGRLLGPLLKTGLPLIGDVLKPLAKHVSAIDAAIHKNMFGSGNTTLIISNEKRIIL